MASRHLRPQFRNRLCDRLHVLDNRVKRGVARSTDHHLVVIWLRPGRPKRFVRVCWNCPVESSADYVVVLASSVHNIQLSLDQFAVECEAAGMRMRTSKSHAMVLTLKKVDRFVWVGGEFLPQEDPKFKDRGILFTSEGKMERKILRWIEPASASMQFLH